MGVLERVADAYVARRGPAAVESRFTWDDYVSLFSGDPYAYWGFAQTVSGSEERIESNFEAFVGGAYKRSGVVFACILSRLLVFSEARFQWRAFNKGRPGALFGNQDLALLEQPWPNGTTGDLLARMEQDGTIAGNFLATRRVISGRPRVVRMRPDWCTFVLGSHEDPKIEPYDLDAEVIGLIYEPPGGTAEILLPGEYAHFAPIPDPIASYRGMSLLSSVIRDIEGDQAAITHKLNFFKNGGAPGYVVTLDASVTPEGFERFKAKMNAEHRGAHNAYKTLYLGGGADIKTVGSTFEQMSYKAIQAMGETRIAAAMGVPPVIVGLSEGLASATYSNYAQARRRFADGTLRPLWRQAAGALATLLPQQTGGAQLWYDDRDVMFLQEDQKDRAEIFEIESRTITQYVREGFTAESAIAATAAQDSSLLVHTGLVSVQLQAPGTPALPTSPQSQDDAGDSADEEEPT